MEKHRKWYTRSRTRHNLVTRGLAFVFGRQPAAERSSWDKDDVTCAQLLRRLRREVVVI